MKKAKFIFLYFIMILALAACSRDVPPEETTAVPVVPHTTADAEADTTDADGTVLHVLTDDARRGTIHELIQDMIDVYESKQEEITVQLEILPEDGSQEREARLEQLRIEIMAGKGPDVFLMDTNYIATELLFSDVTMSMRNGLFYDISDFYRNDPDLMPEELRTDIMDSGLWEGKRYVLPLRYDMDVILVDEASLANYNLSTEAITANANSMMDAVLGNPDMPCSALISSHSPFPELINYETDQVTLTAEDIAQYLWWEQEQTCLMATAETDSSVSTSSSVGMYVAFDDYWQGSGCAFVVTGLDYALQSYVVAEALGLETKAYPFRTSDGSVVAEVTYWGAVNANCPIPDAAYDFLSLFLSKEAQWELGRSDAAVATSESFYESGLPVRTVGCVSPLVDILKKFAYDIKGEEEQQRQVAIEAVQLNDADFPLLDIEIDRVRYPIQWEDTIRLAYIETIDFDTMQPTDADIDALAEDLIWGLQLHLGES